MKTCPKCGTLNEDTRYLCTFCRAPILSSTLEEKPKPKRKTPAHQKGWYWLIFIAVFGALLWYASTTAEKKATTGSQSPSSEPSVRCVMPLMTLLEYQ